MHVHEWDEVASVAQQQKQQNLYVLMFFVAIRVATTGSAAHIYRKNPPRVTAFRNRLDLSLSKRIRHGLVAKLNGKRRPWACEALDQILVDYSRARRAPGPITSPYQVRRASVRVSHFSSPPHTYKCIESNSPYKYASLHLYYQDGTKELSSLYMNGLLIFIRNYWEFSMC
jgi:hypothetical protein